MGEIIRSSVAVERIEADVREALQKAKAREGDIAEAAAGRLEPSVAAIDAAQAVLKPAAEAESAAYAKVEAEDDISDAALGLVRDEVWNALGRPRSHPIMDQIFPGGLTTYTAGDPLRQHLLMDILRTRISASAAPQLTPDARAVWTATLTERASAHKAAVDAHAPTGAALAVAQAGYRAAVLAGLARLRSFKRDLKNLGLTETQIHEIIPDRPVETTKKQQDR